MQSELVCARNTITRYLESSEGAPSAIFLSSILRSVANALDAQKITIHALIGGKTRTFEFHGGTQIRSLRMAVEKAAATEQTLNHSADGKSYSSNKGKQICHKWVEGDCAYGDCCRFSHGQPRPKGQRQRMRLIHDGTELGNDSATLSGIGFSVGQSVSIMTVLEGAHMDNILKHFYVPIEQMTDKIDILCGIYSGSYHMWRYEAADTIVVCRQQSEVELVARQVAMRGLCVWRMIQKVIPNRYGQLQRPNGPRYLQHDLEAEQNPMDMHIHDYDPDTYCSGNNHMVIISDNELEDLRLPGGIRVFINYNAGGGSLPSCSESYSWDFSQFPNDQAIVINFVTAKDVSIMKSIESELQIKVEGFQYDVMEHLIRNTCVTHAPHGDDDESFFDCRDMYYQWKWSQSNTETTALLGVCGRPQDTMSGDVNRTDEPGATNAPTYNPSGVSCPNAGTFVIAFMRYLVSSVTLSFVLIVKTIVYSITSKNASLSPDSCDNATATGRPYES